MTLYAYVMTNDDGRAPNPSDEVCTLAHCMPMTRGVAQKGDYVVGLAGAEFGKSRWNIIYAMKVTETLSLDEHDRCFPSRHGPPVRTNRALVSDDFVYWGGGEKAICPPNSLDFLRRAFSNGSRGHRRFTDKRVQTFIEWFSKQPRDKQGEPFHETTRTHRRRPRKKC